MATTRPAAGADHRNQRRHHGAGTSARCRPVVSVDGTLPACREVSSPVSRSLQSPALGLGGVEARLYGVHPGAQVAQRLVFGRHQQAPRPDLAMWHLRACPGGRPYGAIAPARCSKVCASTAGETQCSVARSYNVDQSTISRL
jgi:hypothetical protein